MFTRQQGHFSHTEKQVIPKILSKLSTSTVLHEDIPTEYDSLICNYQIVDYSTL